MRIDSIISSSFISSLPFEKEAKENLNALERVQQNYFEQFYLLLNSDYLELTINELKLKQICQKMENQATQSRENIFAIFLDSPILAAELKEEYETQFCDLYSQMAEMSEKVLTEAQQNIKLKMEELASNYPINLAAAQRLNVLIKQYEQLNVIIDEQLTFVKNQSAKINE